MTVANCTCSRRTMRLLLCSTCNKFTEIIMSCIDTCLQTDKRHTHMHTWEYSMYTTRLYILYNANLRSNMHTSLYTHQHQRNMHLYNLYNMTEYIMRLATHACIHISTFLHTSIYAQTCIQTLLYTYRHACIHTFMHNIHISIHTCKYTFMHAYIHIYIHTYVQTYIHTYIQTYIHW